MADDLEARLESHAQAFEGLLSLIPAKDYYGQDNSDQWTRKKQTKEQKRAAKRAKLNPENQKTAKDVMDENEKKRKRELGIDSDSEDESTPATAIPEPESTGDELRKNKKQKVDGKPETSEEKEAAKKAAAADKRKEKRQAKKEKAEKVKQKQDAKKSKKQDKDLDELAAEKTNADDADSDDDQDMEDAPQSDHVDAMDFSGLVDEDDHSIPTSPERDSSVFDTSNQQSAASSSSSIVPPAEAPTSNATETKEKKERALKLPEVDAEELQNRLRARIEELRARRKADGPTGQARSRQELLETRRKKEEARKAHKKELRLKSKQAEEVKNNERLRGSGSPLSTDIFSPRVEENNFSFGRVAFEDGVEADATLSSLNEHKKRKGPQDTRSALQAAEKKAQRLAGLDVEKRADIEEKDLWLNAKKKAHGEKLRDDQSLLRKALKRKEKIKTKSATEWNERLDNVRKGKEMKDERRERNLAKRREDKGSKKGGKKGGAKGGAKGGSKGSSGGKKGRPGFEGRFKA
ncbi:hypothetical protein AAFC00_001252 [Neodothiora populina]|uniref:SURF6-domain-containing protein n=1 Tax=Neodothiora populina TaxID=2781224 RepID=A0ABR3PNK3_9PEZI